MHQDLSTAQRHKLLDQLDDAYFSISSSEYVENRKEMEVLRRPPVSLSAIRRQLSPDESLIEFVLDKNKSYALQITQAGLEVHELPEKAANRPAGDSDFSLASGTSGSRTIWERRCTVAFCRRLWRSARRR